MSDEKVVTRRRVLLVEDDDEDYEFTRDLFAEIQMPVHELYRARDFDAAVETADGSSTTSVSSTIGSRGQRTVSTSPGS